MPSWRKLQHQFWGSISRPGYILFLLAVAATFGSMGFLFDLVNTHAPYSTTFYRTIFCALVAVGWFVSMTRTLRLFPIVIAFHVVGGWFLGGPALRPPFVAFAGLPFDQRLKFDMLGAFVCIVLGYIGFTMFAAREGRQWIAVDAEMRLARNIHQALVPRIERTVERTVERTTEGTAGRTAEGTAGRTAGRTGGRVEFHGFSAPSGHVGGDLVDLVTLPDGRWLGYVADVSGHGVSSGLLMAMVKSGMRMRTSEWPPLPALVSDLNRLMCDQSAPAMFVTMACVRGSSADDAVEGGGIEFTLAGHPPMLRVREGVVTELVESHIPLGVMPDWTFGSATIDVQDGDLLALVTDGLFEVFDAKDHEFGLDGIKSVLASSKDRPLAEIASQILERAREFGPQLDDQTLLLIRFGPKIMQR